MRWQLALSWTPRAQFLQTRRTITPKKCSIRLSAVTPTNSCFALRSRIEASQGIVQSHDLGHWNSEHGGWVGVFTRLGLECCKSDEVHSGRGSERGIRYGSCQNKARNQRAAC